jgi:hypothetical protein
MPTLGELALMQRGVVAEISEFLGSNSPAERRFAAVNKNVLYLANLIKTRDGKNKSNLTESP